MRQEDGGRRVLVIEDSFASADSLREALEVCGHVVEVAQSGQEGLDKARLFHPDAILCDVGLPRMNGYQVAQAIRSDPELRPVFLVALTGYAAPADIQRAFDSGFDRHVAKPPDLNDLDEVLRLAPLRTSTAAA